MNHFCVLKKMPIKNPSVNYINRPQVGNGGGEVEQSWFPRLNPLHALRPFLRFS
jgi:hypothetical protein